jgi:SAM-dependent methyltransferase
LVSSRPIDGYDARIMAELDRYSEVEEVHDLPSVHHLWTERFVTPLFAELGVASIGALWERSLEEQCRRKAPEPVRLVSLGAGNGDSEQQLAVRLAERGVTNLELLLLELNPSMIQRGMQSAERLGLDQRVRMERADLNTWVASGPADVYLAVHSLHHVVELEHLFEQVSRSLEPEGLLLVNDMIGRNGHVRWPEAGAIVRGIWRQMPERYRHNHFTRRIDNEYPDADCSTVGFEGIRSQDILPLLRERFYPGVYVGFGNVIDPFVDRAYGPNFNIDSPEDVAFIERVASLDDAAIDLGVVTPTHLVATFSPTPTLCRYPRDRSPERTVRNPRIGNHVPPPARPARRPLHLRRKLSRLARRTR